METAKRILIVDDEKRIRNTLSNILNLKNYETITAENGMEAVKHISSKTIDVVLLDFVLPEQNGLQVMEDIHKINPIVPIIIMTAYGSVPNAVEAIKKGAYDFVEKPLDADKILVTIKNAIDKHTLSRENEILRQNILEHYKMVGDSACMRKVSYQIKHLAPRDTTVLITGESGTGKELVARSLHSMSLRVGKPFVKVNCAAIPNDLIESELFGHKRGAFTGAHQDQMGKFEAANNGTLFLDEIGELNTNVQSKLLQALEDKRFYRLGDVKEITVDVRLISATNKNLIEEIENGNFRRDLYFRLNATTIHIPPLRDRIEDIPKLVRFLTENICEELSLPNKIFNSDALHPFVTYSWPGNVRELKNKLREMLIYHQGEVIAGEYVQSWFNNVTTEHSVQIDNSSNLRQARENFEREYIHKILIANNWNVPSAAEELGIERTNLYRKIKQLGIEKL